MRPRRPSLSSSWIALTVSLAACGSAASPDRFKTLADTIEGERRELGVPGVAVALVEGGEVTFARGFGTKDPGGRDPVTPATLFRIGSLTKALTAIALLQAVQAGSVDLDRPVIEYLPDFRLTKTPAPVPGITVRHLLTHTGGLFDYIELDAPPDERADDALEGFFTGRFAGIGYLQSPPGAFYAYANPDYMLAGLVAQKVSGVSYRQLMRDEVFAPLGMHRTVFLPSEVLSDGDYATGRTCAGSSSDCPWPGGVVRPDSYDNPWARPAGYAWSSVLDMAKLAAFLVHGRDDVLADDLRTAMTSPLVTEPKSAGMSSYGFGMGVSPGFSLSGTYYPVKTISHGGGIDGYSSWLGCIPERDFCFVSLANGEGAFFSKSLVAAIRSLVELPAPATPPDVSSRPERYASYAGTYVDPFVLGKVEVTTDGGKLLLQVDALDSAGIPYGRELEPTILDNFTFELGGETTDVTFIADASEGYAYVYSRPFVAVRVVAQP